MERIDYKNMKDDYMTEVLALFLEKYTFALKYISGKKVFDAGCGTGLGTFIYSLGAKHIEAIDDDQGALDLCKQLNYQCPVRFQKADLNTCKLPKTDVCVAIETLEHFKPGNTFLKRLKADLLVFSIPLDHPGGWHLQEFKTPKDVVLYLAENGWRAYDTQVHTGDTLMRICNKSLMGVAERIK